MGWWLTVGKPIDDSIYVALHVAQHKIPIFKMNKPDNPPKT